MPALQHSTRSGEVGSNEGSLRFDGEAYRQMMSVHEVPLTDCEKTIVDIHQTFHTVALHELRDHNAAVARGERKRTIPKSDMPGLRAAMVSIQRITKCLFPTSLVFPDGHIVINEYFVRLFARLRYQTMKDWKGWIDDYPLTEPTLILGELGSAILYSIAINAIRGHFPINEYGFAVFNPDEKAAQGQRGRRHLYINTLGMLYYWVILAERHRYPDDRVRFLMQRYPHLFSGLSPAERGKLPRHLLSFCVKQMDYGAWPFPDRIVETGTHIDEVERAVANFRWCATRKGKA